MRVEKRNPLALSALALTLIGGVVWAGEEQREDNAGGREARRSPIAQATGGKAKGSTGSKVYGNDDLEKMFGPAEPARPEPETTSDGSADAPDASTPPATQEREKTALERMQVSKAEGEERATKVHEAEGRVTAARERVAKLEQRLLATKNPFLSRPAPPEEGEDGAEGWEKKDGRERVQTTQGEIEKAKQDLAKAERELAEARAGGS
jgi:hypothetical protein